MLQTRLELDRPGRQLVGAVGERLTADEMGELVSDLVARYVAHDALHLIVANPATGTVSFGFWRHYPHDLAYAEMRNAYLGDDPMSPRLLASRPLPVGVLHAAGSDDLRARAILRSHRVGGELRAVLRDAHAVWGTLCLFREEGGRRFGEEEAQRLRRLTPSLIAALRGYVTATPLPLDAPRPAAGVILIGADHTVRGVTPEARAWLTALRGSAWLSDPRWAAMALASETPHGDPWLCVPAAHCGSWVSMRAQPLGPGGDVAVVVQAAAGPALLPALAAWHGLTARELTVLELLRAGLAPKQVARRLGRSPHTVNDHIKALFHKVRVNGRDELIAAVG